MSFLVLQNSVFNVKDIAIISYDQDTINCDISIIDIRGNRSKINLKSEKRINSLDDIEFQCCNPECDLYYLTNGVYLNLKNVISINFNEKTLNNTKTWVANIIFNSSSNIPSTIPLDNTVYKSQEDINFLLDDLKERIAWN